MKCPHTFFAEARLARDSLSALGAANTNDLREYPGARGKRAHKRLHREIAKVLKGKLSKTGAELAVGMNEGTTPDRRAAEGVAVRKWSREIAMLSAVAQRTQKPADIRRCAHAVATLNALEASSMLHEPRHDGHEYEQAVTDYVYYTDMLRALARGHGYTRLHPGGWKLPSEMVFPVPPGTPVRGREPLVSPPKAFAKRVARDIADVDLDTPYTDPLA